MTAVGIYSKRFFTLLLRMHCYSCSLPSLNILTKAVYCSWNQIPHVEVLLKQDLVNYSLNCENIERDEGSVPLITESQLG